MAGMEFDAGLFVWTLITFGGVLFILARFAFKPLKKILNEREASIRESLEQAETARTEARGLLEENRRQIEEAREQARRVIGEGHRIVADMKREAHARAEEEASQIVRQASVEIDREVQRSLDELKGTVANLSVRVASQIIREELDEKRHEALVDDFVERLKKSNAKRRK